MSTELQSIQNEIDGLEKKKEAILKGQRAAKLTEVKSIIDLFGFTASDLGLAVKGKKKVVASSVSKPKLEAKYANPKDPSQTWHGGKGRRPAWMKEYEDNGGNREALLITLKTS